MYECRICEDQKSDETKVILGCSEKHPFCNECFELWKRFAPLEICPYCRTPYVSEDQNPEEWLYLDPKEWVVYNKTDKKWGSGKIFVYRRDESQPSWRNDDYVVELKRNRRRKKKWVK